MKTRRETHQIFLVCFPPFNVQVSETIFESGIFSIEKLINTMVPVGITTDDSK
jgi:hypothetical protein